MLSLSEWKPNMADDKRITNSKPIPHIPLPFKDVIADVLKVKPPDKPKKESSQR